MTVTSFAILIAKIDFEEEKLSQKDIRLLFTLSLQTQVDELYHTRHLNMTLLEFKESLGRLSDRVLPTVPFRYGKTDTKSLSVKMEYLLHLIGTRAMSKEFKDNFLP